MVVAARLPVRAWKLLAWPLMVVAIGGLLLVFSPLGVVVNASRNWVAIGSLTVQPAEAAKLALVVWAAAVLRPRSRCSTAPRHVLVPVAIPVRSCCWGSCWPGATWAPGRADGADDRPAVLRRCADPVFVLMGGRSGRSGGDPDGSGQHEPDERGSPAG